MARLRQATPAHRHAASLRRDGALNRLSSLTSAIAIGTIAAVGALGIYVAKAVPGHHSGANTATANATATSGNSGQNTGSSGSSNGLNPPSTAPQSAVAPAPVVSGSS